VGFGIAILWRAALDDVRDIDAVALQPDGLDDLRQLLPGPPDKRDALNVFVASRRLAHEHQIGGGAADAKNNLLPSELAQLAPRAIADVLANGAQPGCARLAGLHRLPGLFRLPRLPGLFRLFRLSGLLRL